MCRKLTLFLFAAILIALPEATMAFDPAAGLPPGVSYRTSVEGIHEYRLENGLKVLLFPDPSKQTATVNITYLVGSLHEGYGETGMAHLLEHLLFKGSANHPNIPDELTSHGARPNGSTWYDRTNYFETFSATEENLDWALDLEADRMVNSFVARKDLDSEMSVVRNEFEIGENDPMSILEERVYSTAFLWHNYGKSTIGARSDIENVPIERLQAFYRTWYRPDNAILVVAGRFDPAATLALVQQKFAPIPVPDVPVPTVYTEEPAQDGERTVTLRRVGDIQAVAAAYHIPSSSHEDYPAMAVLAQVLGDTPSGRLHKALIETNRATSVRGRSDRFKDAALFYLSAELREEQDLEAVHDEIIAIAEGLADHPVTREEVDRARGSLLRRWETTMRNTSRAAIRMSEWAAKGDWRLMFVYRDRLQEVTAEDVNRAAVKYLQSTNRTVGRYKPTEKPVRVSVPPTPDVAALLEGYEGGEALALGEDFDPSPENIEALVRRSTTTAGMKFVLLPKKTRGETVNLHMQLHFGTETALENKGRVGEFAARMLMRGTTTRSRQDIRDEIDRLKAQFSVRGNAAGATATIETTRENLLDAVRLLTDVLRNPSFDATEFKQLKDETIAALEESRTEPRSQSQIALTRHLTPYERSNVRYTPTTDERIEDVGAVTLDDVRAFHQAFYGASAAELAVVGDFDQAEVSTLVDSGFGDWTAREPYERLVSTFESRPVILETIEIPDKESAVYRGGLRIPMKDSDPDYAAVVLGNFMTGGGFLNSRLATRIRQKDGLSYGVGSWFSASSWDESATLWVFAIYAPQNDARLVTAVEEEFRRILDSGFEADEVADARSGWLQQQDVTRSTDRSLAARLAGYEERGRTMDWDTQLETRIASLTPEEIHQAFRKHADPQKLSAVRAGSFAGREETPDDSSQNVND